MIDHRHTRNEETNALLTWHIDLANRETKARAAFAPLESVALHEEPEDLGDGLALALLRAERARLLSNLETVETERAMWQHVGEHLLAAHALDVYARDAKEQLWKSLSTLAETRDYGAYVRRMRGRE